MGDSVHDERADASMLVAQVWAFTITSSPGPIPRAVDIKVQRRCG
ncbi:hypothetical protein ACIHDR_11835 [Nocardia sp. NPDC052278]